MIGVLGLAFALRLAASSVAPGEIPPVFEPAPNAGLGAPIHVRQEGTDDILALSVARQPALAGFSFRHSYRPREWVTLVADRLNMSDAGVTQLALWVASWPLQLDASESRVYLRVTLTTP